MDISSGSKQILCRLFLAAAVAPFLLPQRGLAQKTEVAVASDVHVMAPALLQEECKAYGEYMSSDRKMLRESPLLLDELTARLRSGRPQFVLLTGDLTKDGEEVSHRYLVEHCLRPLLEAGIRPLVIPGNHDVNNPHAVVFMGDTTRRVKTVSREEFARIYADYGYGDALARDTASLSYVFRLTPRLRLLALDACEYDRNDFAADRCHHEGYVRPATLRFVERQLAEAKAHGEEVIAMMHHGLTEHWRYQNRVLPGYVADNADALDELLAKGGVKVIFTGHLHTQDIARTKRGTLDIETGSLVSYPSPYRLVTVDEGAGTISVITKNVDAVAGLDTGGKSFADYGREHTSAGVRSIVGKMLPEKVPADLRASATEIITQAMADNYCGNEVLTPQSKAEIKATAKRLRRHTFKWSIVFKRVARALLDDAEPEDHTLTVSYKR